MSTVVPFAGAKRETPLVVPPETYDLSFARAAAIALRAEIIVTSEQLKRKQGELALWEDLIKSVERGCP